MVSSRKPARVIWASAKSQKTWIRNNRFRNAVYFLLGLSRSPPPRTLYNASRPFSVMGGLSDKEVEFLQKARGPEAQMALCLIWLKEFVSREHLDGSTGKVAPPIVALVACLSNFATLACFDGMHEVARELQDPFYQFPNDLPLNNCEVQFNEALISCLYGGFHPDAPGRNKERREQ